MEAFERSLDTRLPSALKTPYHELKNTLLDWMGMAVSMKPSDILDDLLARYSGTRAVEAWGETSLFYNPGDLLPRGVYFATVKEKDGENDKASALDRRNVFRFNIGTSKPLFIDRFGHPPKRPGKGCHIEGPWDFKALNQITPHPVYGWMSWVSVLNPSYDTFAGLAPMIDAAFEKAKANFDKKIAKTP